LQAKQLDLYETAFSCLFASKTACLGKKQPFHMYFASKQPAMVRNSLLVSICKQNSLPWSETAISNIFASKTACLGKNQSFHVYLQAKQLGFV